MYFIRLFLLLSLLFGCQKNSPKQRYVNIAFQSSIRSLDPGIGIDYPSTFVTKMLFEGLTYIGPDGQVRLGIAKSYEISEDQKTYTFFLKDCVWTNGDPITAHDFEYSWKKVINPEGDTIGAQNFYPVKNARDVVIGAKPIDTVGIKALDDKTLQVELEHPTPYFLEAAATTSYMPVNAKVAAQDPNWSNREDAEFVCNGPFYLKKHQFESELLVLKNPHYWNQEKVQLPGIRIAIIKDTSTQLSLYEKNRLDWLGNPFSKIPTDALEHLKKKGEVHFYKCLGLYWYYVNIESFPFHNTKMRRAFAYAIDRKAITDFILQAKEVPATGILPYILATQSTPFFTDSQEKALQLFNEALDEMGLSKEELPEITLNYAALPIHARVAEAIQAQWSEVFDIDIKLEHQDWPAHFSKLQKGNFQIGGVSWRSWLRDPIYNLQTFRDKSDGVNLSRWESKEYQDLLSRSDEEIDREKRRQLFNKAEILLMKEMPVIPVYNETLAYAKNKDLKNVYISELYNVDFRWSYFEE